MVNAAPARPPMSEKKRKTEKYAKAEERLSRLLALNELSQRISQSLALDETLERIVRAAAELLSADLSRLFLHDERSGEVLLRTWHGSDIPPHAPDVPIPSGKGITGSVFATGRPAIVEDIQEDPRWLGSEWAREHAVHSYIAHPFRQGDRVIGVLACVSKKKAFYKRGDLELLNALGAQAAIAIQNARLHEEARRSRDFLQSILQQSTDAVVAVDAEERLLFWNPAAERLYGYTAEEALGQSIELIIPEAERAQWKRERKATMASGGAFHHEVVRRRKDGSPVLVGITRWPLRDGDGRLVAAAGVHRDLTEVKRAEQERLGYVERLKTLNVLNQKTAASLDLQETLEFVVRSAADLLQVPYVGLLLLADSVLKMQAEHRVGIGPQGLPELPIGQGLGGLVASSGETRYVEDVLQDPGWVSTEWARREGLRSFLGVPLRHGSRILGLLTCLVRGIRRFTKEEIELMETFAGAAAIAIDNAETHSRLKASLEDLKRSQAMIVRAEKLSALGTLAAGAAHEILNPANVIGMHAQQMIRQGAKETEERKVAETIWENVNRISRICDGLRRFSRDEKAQAAPFVPDEAIEECLQLLAHKLRLASIKVSRRWGAGKAAVKGDRSQMVQVFLNLIRNAIDAMPGGGTLTVSTSVAGDAGARWWEARCADTGCGIPEEVMPRIFDPFYTTKPEDKGTGLGLAVSHGIVEGHGGRIWAESLPGEGATFIIRLPLMPY